jgi:hypothetical protein
VRRADKAGFVQGRRVVHAAARHGVEKLVEGSVIGN